MSSEERPRTEIVGNGLCVTFPLPGVRGVDEDNDDLYCLSQFADSTLISPVQPTHIYTYILSTSSIKTFSLCTLL